MLTRRTFLQQAALAAGALRTASAAGTSNASPAIVKTSWGELRGEGKDGVRTFRGVPFAQPPVGPLRFRPPQPLTPWNGVREALHFGAAAMQPGDRSLPQSEDCLYLNLWAPESGGPYPVFVWIHGGGFTGGHSFDPLFDGSSFARAGIVCITVAYRLGVFGFLDLSPLLGAEYAGSANHALRDLTAALKWVQLNVGAFGGDPHRVTVGGESAGAKLTDILLGTPSAAPLFQQAISESGGAERYWAAERAAEVGRGFGDLWIQRTSSPPARLLQAPARELIAAQEQFTRDWPAHFPLRAQLDSAFVPRPPLQAIRAGSSRGKRLLLGTNRDESALFLGPHPQREPLRSDLGNLPIEQFEPVEKAYAKLYPAMTPELRRIRSVTAEEYWVPSMRFAEAHLAGGGGDTFVYRLDFPGEGQYAGLAFHSYDLRFVWDHFGEAMPSGAARRLGSTMHSAWAAFIQGNVPQAPDLPPWPRYSLDHRPTMLLDSTSHVEQSPQSAELELWQGLLSD